MEGFFPSEKNISKVKLPRRTLEPIAPICLSKKLDEVLNDAKLKISYKTPECSRKVPDGLAGGLKVPSVDMVCVFKQG